MEKQKVNSLQIFLTAGAIITWLAVGLQFYLIIVNRVTSVPETIIRFFSFYTILTNILVAFCLTFLLLKPNSNLGTFFSRPGVVTAITLYITVVGIIYNIVLRFLWHPVGLQKVADELLHVVVPLLFIFYWLRYAPKVGLQWKNVFPWLIYPSVYVIFILVRGALSGYYPYPFIDVNALGYKTVFLNSIILFCVFLVLSLLLVGIIKIRSKFSD